MDILFIADPLTQFKIYKDSTYAMMAEAALHAFQTDDARLNPLCEKILANERLNSEDALALYQSKDILALGWLANHVREDVRNVRRDAGRGSHANGHRGVESAKDVAHRVDQKKPFWGFCRHLVSETVRFARPASSSGRPRMDQYSRRCAAFAATW